MIFWECLRPGLHALSTNRPFIVVCATFLVHQTTSVRSFQHFSSSWLILPAAPYDKALYILSLTRWVFRYVGNKAYDFSSKKKDFLPKNDQIWPKIGIFGQFGPGHAGFFGALLVGRLVVVARGLYLARHLFTLSIKKGFADIATAIYRYWACRYLRPHPKDARSRSPWRSKPHSVPLMSFLCTRFVFFKLNY